MMDKNNNAEQNGLETTDCGKKKLDKRKRIYIFSTVGLSAFFCVFYYFTMEVSARDPRFAYFFPVVMFAYMAALTILCCPTNGARKERQSLFVAVKKDLNAQSGFSFLSFRFCSPLSLRR